MNREELKDRCWSAFVCSVVSIGSCTVAWLTLGVSPTFNFFWFVFCVAIVLLSSFFVATWHDEYVRMLLCLFIFVGLFVLCVAMLTEFSKIPKSFAFMVIFYAQIVSVGFLFMKLNALCRYLKEHVERYQDKR